VAAGADGARGAAAVGRARAAATPADAELPSAIPAFLEACAKLAADAAARGDHARAREVIEVAVRMAAIPEGR
jgi:hypothetical protein